MAIIPNFFLDAVVALGVDGRDGDKHWIGTGFIVGRKENDNPTFSTYYIVTNKHVIKNERYVYVRFNSLGGTLVKDYRIDLYDKAGVPMYSAHPHDKTDIIALQILPRTLINDKSIWGAFDLTDHALTLNEMQTTGVTEGSLVYALGFPMDLVDPIKVPICRLGCISRVTDAFLLKKGTPIFLIDAQTFPGNSGGPIVNRPEHMSIDGTPHNESANLIGILSAYIPYRETLYSRQTGRDRMIQEENSGLTIVHPVDRIKEVVELEWARIEKQNAAPKTVNPPALEAAKEEVAV
ncbi:MAG: trypsin-like peptidase domain-containing protein [Ruminococcaceae bacterium]|nr:trypsin-like peptidase domain-containing protein [Oscillospiraceae bacterium]